MTDPITDLEAAAYVLGDGTPYSTGGWVAALKIGVALGFPMETLLKVAETITDPGTFATTLAVAGRWDSSRSPVLQVQVRRDVRVKMGQVRHLAAGRPADEYNESEALQAMIDRVSKR